MTVASEYHPLALVQECRVPIATRRLLFVVNFHFLHLLMLFVPLEEALLLLCKLNRAVRAPSFLHEHVVAVEAGISVFDDERVFH